MAGRTSWTIVIDAAEWQLIRIRGATAEVVAREQAEPFVPREVAVHLAAKLAECGHQFRQSVLLALGSDHCVSATVSIPSARIARNHQAMCYLLEPLLPWSVEDAVIDFERTETHALMVAARSAPLQEMIACWHDAGISVASIVPHARLTLERHHGRRQSGRHLFLSGNATAVDAWLMDGVHPLEWQHLPARPADIVRQLKWRLLSESGPLTVVCHHLSEEMIVALQRVADIELKQTDESPVDSPSIDATRVGRILSGRDPAPIELLRGPLLRSDRMSATQRMTDWLLVSAMLLLICVGAAFLMKAEQANTRREDLLEQQQQVFRQVLPDQRVQQAVRGRLTSEWRRLQGLRGEGVALPQTTPAAMVINRLLGSLPEDLRFRLLEIRMADGKLNLEGEVRDHSDADTIATGLRNAGMTVASPQTFRLADRGVGFRISASVNDAMVAKGPT